METKTCLTQEIACAIKLKCKSYTEFTSKLTLTSVKLENKLYLWCTSRKKVNKLLLSNKQLSTFIILFSTLWLLLCSLPGGLSSKTTVLCKGKLSTHEAGLTFPGLPCPRVAGALLGLVLPPYDGESESSAMTVSILILLLRQQTPPHHRLCNQSELRIASVTAMSDAFKLC